MHISKLSLVILMAVCLTAARAEMDKREPHIGYLYPAGGQQGTTFEIVAGGQFLRGAGGVYVSGEGVRAQVVKYIRPLTGKQRQLLMMRIGELRQQKAAQLPPMAQALLPRGNELKARDANKPDMNEPFDMPDHPLLQNLESKSLKELQEVMKIFFDPKRQQNVQLSEMAVIRVTIDANAPPGERDMRIETEGGLTNPMRFEVGILPEISEPQFSYSETPAVKPTSVPVVFNGQIMPGQVDHFRFAAHSGQHLVIQAHARRLIPYLADAVPGWFQAAVSIHDSNGHELAFADDYRFDPDPVLYYEISKGGQYELEIRDALYRGREDFVYRVAVSEQPFITQMFPLGGRVGVPTVALIGGWNLPRRKLMLDTQPDLGAIRQASLQQKKWLSNYVAYQVDTLPECNAIEKNHSMKDAQNITLPQMINGRIEKGGDMDIFKFDAKAGDKVVAEVYARRLGSPLDSLLKLTNSSGAVLAWNDDHEDKETGLLTHQADSYLTATLPADGTYCVQLSDAQNHGGKEYGYRLRISPPRPDFALYMTPSTLNIPAGRASAFYVNVFRKEGFGGGIELMLKDAPEGFRLTGGYIPADCNRIQVTIAAPEKSHGRPAALKLEGRALIEGNSVSRAVIPAEDMMQAFAYRHFVPSQELMADVTNARRFAPSFELTSDRPVKIPVGGTAEVNVKMWKRPMLRDLKLELSQPPKGITLQNAIIKSDEVILTLKADDKAVQAGYKNNLIFEASAEMTPNRQGGKGAGKQRVFLGVLPAISFEVAP